MSQEPAAEAPDPVSPAILDLLAVFAGPLADVQFPGVDHGTLQALVDQVRENAQHLDALRAQLDTLHAHLTDARARLQRTAEQGLAYARIYAADDPDLEARLADIGLAASGKAAEPRRRRLEVAPEAATAEPLRLPPRRGRKPRVVAEAVAGS